MKTLPRLPLARRAMAISALMVAMSLVGCGASSPGEQAAQGKVALGKGDAAAAVVHLKAALQGDPDLLEARVLLGQALLQSGDAVGASIEFSKALAQQARPDDVLPGLAAAMLMTSQARKLVADHGQKQLQDRLAQADFQTQLAAAWTILGDAKNADAAIARAREAAPELPSAKLQHARILIARGETSRALAILEPLTQGESTGSEAWYLKAEALSTDGGEPAAIEQALRRALEIDPRHVSAHASLAVLKMRLKDLSAAKVQYNTLREFAPASSETVFVGAQVAWFDKDFRKARDGVQQLLRLNPEDPRLLQFAAAIEWQEGGSLVIAQKHLETAIRVDPSLDAARANLAHVLLRQGQPARALAAVESVVRSERAPPLALSAAGEAALQLGDPAAAEGFFKRAAAALPDDAKPKTSLALAQIAGGNERDGFYLLESLAAKAGDGYADAALASARIKRNELPEALRAIDAMLAKSPRNAAAYEMRGRVLMSLRRLAEAREAFKTAMQIDPRGIVPMVGLADLELLDGRPEEARKVLASFIQANPGEHVAITALSSLRIKAGEPAAEVIASVQNAIKAQPAEPAPRLKLIELLSSQRQLKAAVAAGQEASAFFPDDVQVLDAYGRALMAAGDHEQALTAFRRVTSIDPNLAVAHLRLAEAHKALGNTSAQVASLRRAVEVDPRQALARSSLVNLLVDAKRTREALDIARELQAREPASAGGYLLEGAIHRKLGDHDASAVVYRRGLERASDPADLPMNLLVSLLAADRFQAAEAFALGWLGKHPNDGAVTYNLAEGYLKYRDYPKAERLFSTALSLRPDHVPSLNNLAWLRTKLGKPGAVDLASQASRLAPDQPAILDTLGLALAAEKRHSEALVAQKRAVELAPGSAELRLNLARVAIAAGDKSLARAELERLIAQGDRSGFKAAASQLLATL